MGKKMEIKKVILHHFKGVKDAEYDFGHQTWIKGQNGSGKSTIATAILWTLADYDYAISNNPMVEPLDMEECSPTVTLVCDISGKEVSITKLQNIRKTYDDSGIEKKSTNNKYMVNDVPITQRDFKAKMLDYGINTDMILPLMHPMYFVSQKPSDQKKFLYGMTEKHTDFEIAQMGDDTPHLVELLADYSVEEVSVKYKASKKKADELIKAIPNQIIGMESSKSAQDPQPLLDRKEELLTEIKSIEEEFAKNDKSAEVAEIRSKYFEAQKELAAFERKLKDDESFMRRKDAEEVLRIKKKISEQEDVVYTLERQIKDAERDVFTNTSEKNRCAVLYKALKKEKPPVFKEHEKLSESDMVCPCCGQQLPEDLKKQKIDSYNEELAKAKAQFDRDLTAWNRKHDKDIEDVTAEGQTACDNIRLAEQKMSKTSTSLTNQKVELERLRGFLEDAIANESRAYKMSSADAQQFDKLKEKVSYQEQLLKASSEISPAKEDTDAKISALQMEIKEIDSQLAVIYNNDRIDKKIGELEVERMTQEQNKADAEMILYELDLLSKKKNDLLVEEINSHFSLVKFQLFEYQKNGGYKEICVPTIDGYRFGESTNTGREIRGKLDICQSLQKFYGITVPIILDNAESINDFNLPKLDSQLILLSVTEDKNLVVEHD